MRVRTHFMAAALASAALLLTVASPASAQVAYGPKGGLNVSRVTFESSATTIVPAISARYGFNLGGFVTMDKGKAGLSVEVLYSQKGAKLDFSQAGQVNTIVAHGNYVDIPVLGRLNLKASDTTTIHPYVGPEFGIKVNDEFTQTIRQNNVTTTTTMTDQLKGSDAGIAFGVEFDTHKVLVDVRYNIGLMNVDNQSGTNPPTVKNRTFSFMLGWNLAKK